MTKFKKVIRKRRISLGITLKEFAQQLNLSPGYICKIEKGIYPPPNEQIIHKMAHILQYDPEELMSTAGKLSSDLVRFIIKHPKEVNQVLKELKERTSRNMATTRDTKQLNLFN